MIYNSKYNFDYLQTMHWATPKTKDRMITPSQKMQRSSSSSASSPQNESSFHITRTPKVWERETSDVIRKFRNYEI